MHADLPRPALGALGFQHDTARSYLCCICTRSLIWRQITTLYSLSSRPGQAGCLGPGRRACRAGRRRWGRRRRRARNATGLAALRAAFSLERLADTGAERLWAFGAPLNGTLDGWLLDHWYNGVGRDDALFVRNISDTPQARPETLLPHS